MAQVLPSGWRVGWRRTLTFVHGHRQHLLQLLHVLCTVWVVQAQVQRRAVQHPDGQVLQPDSTGPGALTAVCAHELASDGVLRV